MSRRFERIGDDRRGGRTAEAGFTLLEALVALAVAAACLTAIGSLMAANVRGPGKIYQHLALVETLRAVETALPDQALLAPGGLSGEMAGHQWSIDVQPFPDFPEELLKAHKSTPWTPQAVVITAQSASGAILQVATIRLRQVKGQ